MYILTYFFLNEQTGNHCCSSNFGIYHLYSLQPPIPLFVYPSIPNIMVRTQILRRAYKYHVHGSAYNIIYVGRTCRRDEFRCRPIRHVTNHGRLGYNIFYSITLFTRVDLIIRRDRAREHPLIDFVCFCRRLTISLQYASTSIDVIIATSIVIKIFCPTVDGGVIHLHMKIEQPL